MVKTIDGWVQVGNNFARKMANVYSVVRLVDLDEFVYYEIYLSVKLDSVTEKTFNRYGEHSEYLEQKTDEEKAVYAAIYGLEYDRSYTCHSDEEITTFLRDDGIIEDDETFYMAI